MMKQMPALVEPAFRADLLAFTLQSMAADLATLTEMVSTATQVKDVYPLWVETREIEVALCNLRNEAARTVHRLMEMH